MSDHGDPCEKISVDEETVGLLACSHPQAAEEVARRCTTLF